MAPVPIAIFVEKCYNFGNIFICKLAARFWGAPNQTPNHAITDTVIGSGLE